MGYYEAIRNDLENIYHALIDDESRDWFNARFEYIMTRNDDDFLKALFTIERKYSRKSRHLGLEKVIKGKNIGGIIIYGCGHDGKIIRERIALCGYKIACWCDSDKRIVGTDVEGLRVISPEELIKEYGNYLVVIGSMKYKEEIKEHLRALAFPLENVTVLREKAGEWGGHGNQYFDVFQPSNNEVFVDAGAYNGDTVFGFIDWYKRKDYKIFCLEPSEDMCRCITGKVQKNNLLGVNVLNCAAWHRQEELFFAENGAGSTVIGKEGKIVVKGETIDNIVGALGATFIKLDVEGAELEALRGASKTIQRFHPKLAVCIYHKPLDLLHIGKYILDLNPNYKLCIRHYTLTMYETVLYAFS